MARLHYHADGDALLHRRRERRQLRQWFTMRLIPPVLVGAALYVITDSRECALARYRLPVFQ